MVITSRAQGLGLRVFRAVALSPQPLALCLALTLLTAPANAQAVGGAEKARPVAGDPGIS
jgi:hypothetical protein